MFEWNFAALSGLSIITLQVCYDPAAVDDPVRRLMPAAFGAARTGLLLIMLDPCLQLYEHTARISSSGALRDRRSVKCHRKCKTSPAIKRHTL